MNESGSTNELTRQSVSEGFTVNGKPVLIQRGIPIPQRRARSVWSDLYTLEEGDSFVASVLEERALRGYAVRRGYKIVSRTTHEYALRPMRIWVVAKPA